MLAIYFLTPTYAPLSALESLHTCPSIVYAFLPIMAIASVFFSKANSTYAPLSALESLHTYPSILYAFFPIMAIASVFFFKANHTYAPLSALESLHTYPSILYEFPKTFFITTTDALLFVQMIPALSFSNLFLLTQTSFICNISLVYGVLHILKIHSVFFLRQIGAKRAM